MLNDCPDCCLVCIVILQNTKYSDLIFQTAGRAKHTNVQTYWIYMLTFCISAFPGTLFVGTSQLFGTGTSMPSCALSFPSACVRVAGVACPIGVPGVAGMDTCSLLFVSTIELSDDVSETSDS